MNGHDVQFFTSLEKVLAVHRFGWSLLRLGWVS